MKRIRTTGYRGPLTKMQFIPPGEYTVSGNELDLLTRQLPEHVAAYIVAIGLADVLDDTPALADVESAPDWDPGAVVVAALMEPTQEWANLGGLSLNDLRQMCAARNLSGKGNKAALIARLIEYGH